MRRAANSRVANSLRSGSVSGGRSQQFLL